MPIRTASVKNKLAANGQALHRARAGGDAQAEAELAEERQALKEEREKRKADALLPRPSAIERLVRTHHPESKGKKTRKEHADEAKKPKARRSRAEKHAEQAAAIEAARHSRSTTAKKPAK